jgi:predicted enzyme related to lactoylglutathione lyase
MTTHPHHGIDYVEIPTTNMVASKAFYAASFGWRFNDYGPGYTGYVDGARGDTEAGGFTLAETVTPGGALVILYSTDLDATLARVREAGGTITKEVFDFPGGRRFQFQDPSGIELAVWSQ